MQRKNRETFIDRLKNQLTEVLQEDDFVKRAEKVFALKYETAVSTQREQERLEKLSDRVDVGLAYGAASFLFTWAAAATAIVLASTIPLFPALCLGAAAGLASGLLVGGISSEVSTEKVSNLEKTLEKKSAKLLGNINKAEVELEKAMLLQPDDVKGKYREAFHHAALRMSPIYQAQAAEKISEAGLSSSTSNTTTTIATAAVTAAIVSR